MAELEATDLFTATAWRIKEKLRWIRNADSVRAARWRITSFIRHARRSADMSRAARSAPMSTLPRKVVILMVTTGAKQGPEPEEIVANLAWHDVDAEVKKLPPDYRSVGEVLLDEAAEIGADLLVMGAYSQSRLRDMVLGGVTKAILTHADVPVLMAR